MQERAIPEWRIVKEEILGSKYAASDTLSEWTRLRERNKNNVACFCEFKKHVIALFMKVRTKIDNLKTGSKEGNKYKPVLIPLDAVVLDGKDDITDREWIEYFNLLDSFIEWVGITKIEKTEFDEDESMA